MNAARLQEILRAVAAGEMVPEAAAEELARLPFTDLGFAKLDHHRELRSGSPEAVLAEGKGLADLLEISRRLFAAHGRVLATRVSSEAAPPLLEALAAEPGASAVGESAGPIYHQRARVVTCGAPHSGASESTALAPQPASPEKNPEENPEESAEDGPGQASSGVPGVAVVLSAGTSDLAVAEEAAVVLRWLGHEVETLWDVGVAGLQRLLAHLDLLRRARVLVTVAGMDGALPTAVAGLVSAPVVAVPTSVGYGASFGGLAALLTMLNSCSPGVAVVNIDNGYGAAVLASRILKAT